jgi:outer membrane lipoprotein-sorting protein
VILTSTTVYAEEPSAKEILRAIDSNTFSDSVEMTSSMIVHGERATRTMKSQSWAEGEKRSFTEFLSPPREKGVKMLKIGDDLWTFYPSADRIVKIAGHMLRQSVMGSDMSYEDMMEDRKLSEIYTPTISKKEKIEGRDCYVLSLKAKSDDVAYQSKTLWVDVERLVPLKEGLYAKSGKLLKEIKVLEVKKLENRWYPIHIIYKDKLQKGKGTEMKIHEIKFDVKIPADRFKKSALRR